MPNSLRTRYLLHGSLLWVLILLLGCFTDAQATHIRAGDITAKRDTTPNPNPRRFFFTMIMYTNEASTAEDPQVTINNGDGTTQIVDRLAVIPIGNVTDKEIFKWEYTYPADGSYTISWNGINRNGNILNIAPPSDQVSFFISTTININALRGFNSTPILTVAPIDLAAVGRPFVHNPGAYDPDGDSLAFKLRVPQRRDAASGRIMDVPGYSLPSRTFNCQTSDVTGPAFLTLDLNTGQLIWDSPCKQGEYNVAFVVEEWRVSANGAVKLGEVVRDMQIIVKETENHPPKLTPKDTCIVAGTTLRGVVQATDVDGDRIKLSAASGILPPATFRQTSDQKGAASGAFSWATDCEDVRERPYQVIFRARDVRPPLAIVPRALSGGGTTTDTITDALADLQPWNIRVVGPPPQNLVATGADRTVTLTWDPYICQNAAVIRIYRREGPSGFVPDVCQTGVPSSTGYVLIAEVKPDQTTFTDDNQGAGLKAGVDYCYIIYAQFPSPARGESLASNEACVDIDRDIPYLTNVTVDKTDAATGQITVKWTRPENVAKLTPPLEYRLYRKEGQEKGTGFQQVFSSRTMTDTTYVDKNLNTLQKAFRYRLEFYHAPAAGGQPTVLRDSTEASSVRLEITAAAGEEKALVLNWTYNVPWKNEVLKHRIFRVVNGTFTLIDSVTATASSGTYTDRGAFSNAPLQRGQSYCYYVQTVGTYEISGLPAPLRNNSQEVCATLPKVICAPELSIDQLDCAAFSQSPTQPPYQNVLTWVPQTSGDCTDQIDFYTVYFKGAGDTDYTKLGTTEETTYTHSGLQSYAGCYQVTATDAAGNESPRSNEVCKDNCIFFMLPNIITPNGDGLNDVFRPDKRTSFVKSMNFKVFDRWGVLVYSSGTVTSGEGLYINWAGTDKNGNRLTDGTYYYEADVEFFTIDPSKAHSKYKGWVEIVR
ncbi:gliding motility-associated C-terminal domain-containing protein [Pontibacter liquoris]|uniref:T9SS type B sorting domain-containing protein n=1 Tax=Pontibacter liquoris TaxID=2905677 RepID=UPI001FA78F38|nr:gliding motility-associated C-terminal domain-containing protein [Pontibacter liquoris]